MALPPDVRRGCASPVGKPKDMGLCPWYGLWPMNWGRARTTGRARIFNTRPPARHSLASHPAAEPYENTFGSKPSSTYWRDWLLIIAETGCEDGLGFADREGGRTWLFLENLPGLPENTSCSAERASPPVH